MAGPESAREAALLALMEIDRKNAYARQARDRILHSGDLAMRDRAFCTQLIFGVTKHRKTVDHIIDTFSTRRVRKMDPVTRNTLRLGIYQIHYLDEIPKHAVVYECVALARKHAHPGSAGFVNAVLRSALRNPGAIRFPDFAKDPVSYISLKHSHPEWLVSRWIKRLGPEETERLCQANNEEPPLTIRTNTLKIARWDLILRLGHEGFEAIPSHLVDEAIEIRNTGDLFSHELHLGGMFMAQDIASMLVSYVLSPEPNENVMDLAAAPGGKATHIAQLMGDTGQVIACDVHEHRLDLIRQNLQHLAITSVMPILCDSRRLPDDIRTMKFDKVLLDAPCSGTGVLRRRADLRWQRTDEDLRGLVALQRELLESAACLVKPGGALVYSTCSIEPEENAELISRFLSEHPEFSKDRAEPYLPAGFRTAFPEQGKPFVNTYPHIHEIDGFFIARLIHN
ncbi:MAG: 16S rRNA (cytosine(967)-C(5))-methyltransferase RsmB [Firmicutes bacterium]|jgi:16S rRNA (cytosine967-C5)-methyltransferase|nr:16S rRNA (cytosine(967)-C(5))-methyltransferase RsmB [Bacillota bacterium]